MTILVVGGTGRVGKEVALALSKSGHHVTAIARGGRAHAGSQQLLDSGIKVLNGDLRTPDSLAEAMQNVECVFCSATSMPCPGDDGLEKVDREGILALLESAEERAVQRFIYVSYSGNIRFDSPLEKAKRDCENRLARSRMQSFILRPSYFMEVWLGPMLGFDPANGSVRIYGSGEARVSYISSSNVAEFGVACASASTGAKNTLLEIGGPEPMSQLDAVRAFEEKLGRQIKLEFVPIDSLRAQHESADQLAQTFGALMLSYAQGDEIPGAPETAARYGVRLRSVSEYASSVLSPMSVV